VGRQTMTMRMVLSFSLKGLVAAPPKKILPAFLRKNRLGETMTGGYSVPVSFSIWLTHSASSRFLFSICLLVTPCSSLYFLSTWILTFFLAFLVISWKQL
jgi:hypothetical protein